MTTYSSSVPSAPAKVAALVATVAEVWLQITFVPALFQTVFPAVTFQLPLPGVMVAPSPGVVSQVRAAAKAEGAVSVSETAARSRRFLRLDFMDFLGCLGKLGFC